MKPTKNLKPLSIDQFFRQYMNYTADMRSHIAIYILPNGDIINAHYPNKLSHTELSEMIYSNLEEIALHDPNNLLNTKKSILFNKEYKSLNDVKTALANKIGYKNLSTENKQIIKNTLGDEDLLVHDLGYVKVLIMNRVPFITLPNINFNDKAPRSVQYDTVRNLTEIICAKHSEYSIKTAKENNIYLSHKLENMMQNKE